jgi:hypothetical protein
MRIYSGAMARPLTGDRKRVRFNTTFDPHVIERARACAAAQNLTLPQLIERLLDQEIRREAALLSVIVSKGAERAGQNRKSPRRKGS